MSEKLNPEVPKKNRGLEIARNLLSKLKDRKNHAPEFEKLSPERKAQKVFLDATIKSFTPEGLSSISEFAPPVSAFDFSKLGDGALIAISVTIQAGFSFAGNIEEHNNEYSIFIALVKDKDQKVQAFVPIGREDRQISSKSLIVDGTHFGHGQKEPTFPNVEKVKVKQLTLGNPELDWENPDKTLDPMEIFGSVTGDLDKMSDVVVTYKKIEIIEGGEKSKSPVKQTEKTQVTAPANAAQGLNPV